METLVPGASWNSYRLTCGPDTIPIIRASTPKCSSASRSDLAVASRSRGSGPGSFFPFSSSFVSGTTYAASSETVIPSVRLLPIGVSSSGAGCASPSFGGSPFTACGTSPSTPDDSSYENAACVPVAGFSAATPSSGSGSASSTSSSHTGSWLSGSVSNDPVSSARVIWMSASSGSAHPAGGEPGWRTVRAITRVVSRALRAAPPAFATRFAIVIPVSSRMPESSIRIARICAPSRWKSVVEAQ